MTNDELILKDEADRARVIHELDKNLFIEASAGSGKTSMLVKRMVALVESGIDVDKICTITFTKAAANEFRDRFQLLLLIRTKEEKDLTEEELKEVRGLDKTTPKSRILCAEALNNLDLCFMGTIDSFSNMIISEHPFDALVPSSSSVVGDEELPSLYSKEYSLILEGEYGDELKQKALLFERMNKNARSLFIKDFRSFIEKRTANIIYDKPIGKSIDDILKNEKRIFLNFINAVIDQESNVYSTLKDGVDPSFDEYKTLKYNKKLLNGKWEGNEDKIISLIQYSNKVCLKDYPIGVADLSSYLIKVVKRGKPDQRVELKHSLSKSDKPENIEGDQEKTIYNIIQNLKYRINVDFLESAANVIAPKLKKQGKLTFFDYSLYLIEMLQRDIDADKSLIKYIQKRHTHFLLDEFQDTDPMQSQMFFYLASSLPDKDIHKCKLIPGSIFIVGDPKQSIYRFRGADVASYIDIENLFDKENVIVLSRNFRSTPIMKDYFNTVFSNIFPKQATLSQSTFSPIPFTEKVEKTGLVEGVYSYDSSKDDDVASVCKMIKRLVHNDKFMIQGPKDKNKRPIEYKDFMLIPYGKTNIASYLIEFEKQGIPFVVEGNVTFSKCAALQDIYYIITSIINPTDPLSLYKALTCKTIGLSDERLISTGFKKLNYNIFNYENKIKIKDKEYELIDDVIKLELKKLKSLYDKSIVLSPSSLFKKILETYKLFESVSSDYLEYLYYTIELIKSKEKDCSISNLNDCKVYLEKLLKEESGIERCISLDRDYKFKDKVDESGKKIKVDYSKVKIANLHKVKGLEASIVILLYSFDKPKEASDAYIRKDNNYYFFESSEIKEGKPRVYYKTTKYQDVRTRENVLLDEEKLRMLYVAATRARCALIISNYSTETQSKWFSLLYGTTTKEETHNYTPESIFYFLEKLDPIPEDDENNDSSIDLDDNFTNIEKVESSDLYKEAESELIDISNNDVTGSTYKLERPSLLDDTGKADDKDLELFSEDGYSDTLKDVDYAKAVGTLVHRLMQMLVDSKDSYKKEGLINELVLINPNIPHINEILESVYDKIHSDGYKQENGVPSNILPILLNASEVYTEVPFSYFLDGSLWHGVMDVVYKDNDGYHILDYKTNIKRLGLDKKYEKQMKAYEDAFKKILGQDVKALIYHIEI